MKVIGNTNKYNDIINLEYPFKAKDNIDYSIKKVAQFAPFKALKGGENISTQEKTKIYTT